ncbi:MAG: hypothetical protein M1598_07890, partial [Actinobacteria bacterium]|nr:hypothetical protein [Actinomycetota bacterium]
MKKRVQGLVMAVLLLAGILGTAVVTHAQGPAGTAAPGADAPRRLSAQGPDTDQGEEQVEDGVEQKAGAALEDDDRDAGPDEAQPAYTGTVKPGDPEPAEPG